MKNEINKPELTGQIRKELKDLTASVGQMMELFRQIRQPIEESFEKVPTTAEKLESVSKQTEQAANRVLDMVEAINSRESEITDWVRQIRELIPAEILNQNGDLSRLLDKVSQNAENNLNDSFNILDAMQFQDITSQQMDHAITLLDEVEDKLMSLLGSVGIKNGKLQSKSNKKKRVYDPDAKFTMNNGNQQEEIDKIISNR